MFKKNSIFSRILFSYVVIILLLIVSIYLISFKLVKEQHLSRLETSLVAQANSTYKLLERDLNEGKISVLQENIGQLAQSIQARFTLIDHQGKVLLESDANPNEMDNHKERSELKQAFKGKPASSIRYSATIHQEMLYVAVPIFEKNQVKYVTRLSVPITEISLLLNDFRRGIFQASFLVAIFALIVAFVYTKQLTKNLKKLKDACSEISSGSMIGKVDIKSNDEIEDLGKSFNLMAEKLATTISALKTQRTALATIIDSINEVLWVQDYQGRLIHSNKSFHQLFKAKYYQDKYFWELIHDPEIKEIIEKTNPQSPDTTHEIKLANKYYLLSSSKINDQELIYILHDISKIKELQQLKKDFILNASHELRTPLTAIKGFVEHLLEDANSEQLKYLQIIDRNSERLIHLINDIQALAKLEQRPSLILSPINLKDFLYKTSNIFSEQLQKHNLSLTIDIPTDFPHLQVDKFKFEQVFINLIDNAIRYTQEGEITISARTLEDKVEIRVKDSGEGIPSPALKRIFDRFYVVDKSRNRKNGGTGLGLAIAKHIVHLHKGNIRAESQLKQGTEFIITLPLLEENENERDF